MKFRNFIEHCRKSAILRTVKKEVSQDLEIAAVLKSLDGRPVLFENVAGSKYAVVGGLYSSRDLVTEALEIGKSEMIRVLSGAIENHTKNEVVDSAPCQEIIESGVDLDKLPILRYFPRDGGRYVTSGLAITSDPEMGQNLCYHRLMQIGKNRFTARICEGRGTDTFLKRAGGELDIAISIGNSAAVMIAGAISAKKGVNELEIANSLEQTPVVKCKTKDLYVPADCEVVLEGRILAETVDEGPFVDLTETYDIIRKQPVIEITKITHRKNPVFEALLPGGLEHKLMMGMPMEPTIYHAVSKVCRCKNVAITEGGCSWLHAVVQIEKKNDGDARSAIDAAFEAHKSLKHCVVVDGDIDIYDMKDIEWALATRAQADRAKIFKAKGSSLDPSADEQTRMTSKAGIDATMHGDRKKFEKVAYKKVNPGDYV